MKLAETQARMRAAILAGDPSIAGAVVDDGPTPAARLGVYRSNSLGSLVDVLASHFPVVRRLVGEAFFAAAAKKFATEHPPRRAKLSLFGKEFGEFLRAMPEAASVPYLGDVAALEWARNEAYFAADAPPLDPKAFADTPPDAVGALCFELHPASRLLRFEHPAMSIWLAHRGEAETVRLEGARGPEAALVVRPDAHVRARLIALADWALLDALARGEPLAAAADRAFAEDPDFALQAALTEHFATGVFRA